MKLRQLLFLLILLCLFKSGFSQTNFKPGYIITNEHDTVIGLIDYRGDLRNAQKCSFKEYQEGMVTDYKPFEIEAYRFFNSKYYISKSVTHSDSLNKNVFLEYLVDGISDLYYYRDNRGDHYLVTTKSGNIVELNNDKKEIINEGVHYLKPTNQYIGLLKVAYKDCPEIHREIENSRLTHQSLIKVASDYHNYVCDDGKCIIYEKQLHAFKVEFSPFVAASYTQFKLQDPYYLKGNMKAMQLTPRIGFQVFTRLPRLNEKLAFQVSAFIDRNYFFYTWDKPHLLTREFFDLHIHATRPGYHLGLKYIHPTGKVRPNLYIGIGQTFMIYDARLVRESQSDNVIFTDVTGITNYPKSLFSVHTALGFDFDITKKTTAFVKLGYSYETDNEKQIDIIMNGFSLAAGWYL